MAATSNVTTVTLLHGETLANSLGATGLAVGTLLANSVQVSNRTANGSSIFFDLSGQALPINSGSETIYAPVLISIYAGANGNATDTLLASANVNPTIDQQGAFLVSGTIMYLANGVTAVNAVGGGVNTGWGGVVQIPGVALGQVKTIQNLYVGGASNGSVNVVTSTSNVANLSFYAALNTSQNGNASITAIVVQFANANATAAVV